MIRKANIKLALAAFIFSFVIVDSAYAGTIKPVRSPLSFDLTTRKKPKIVINDHLSFSASLGASFLSERNLKLDDLINDRSDQYKALLEIVGRAEISSKTTGFVHLEFGLKRKKTHVKLYGVTSNVRIKEAFITYSFIKGTTISLGRLRFSDKNKWVSDKAVDGIHFGRRLHNSGFEFSIVKDDDENDSTYTFAHYTRFQKKRTIGGYVIAERSVAGAFVHLIGYINNKKNDNFTYTANLGGIFSDTQTGGGNGIGFDFRVTQKITRHKFNPQITYGFAIGSKGFRQTGLQSNKTSDGGQTLCNRYGFVYQPDLTNLAIASVGFALRPSRAFSVDLNTYVYAQVSKQATTPSARVLGYTTGHSSFLGTEVSLIGAWRPTKKMKVEFGVGVFQAGSAYQNKTSTKRVYLRATRYF